MEKAEFEAGGFCDVCKMAVRYVDGILEKNATEMEIEDAVKRVCNFLPDEFKTQVGLNFISVFAFRQVSLLLLGNEHYSLLNRA